MTVQKTFFHQVAIDSTMAIVFNFSILVIFLPFHYGFKLLIIAIGVISCLYIWFACKLLIIDSEGIFEKRLFHKKTLICRFKDINHVNISSNQYYRFHVKELILSSNGIQHKLILSNYNQKYLIYEISKYLTLPKK